MTDNKKQTLLLNQIREEGCVREVARLASVVLPHTGDWLNVVPLPSLGLHLRGTEFTAVVKYRLGVQIFTRAGPCPACGRYSDALGDHAMCCGQQGERIARHNYLRDALFSAAQSAALAPTKESCFFLPVTDRRHADFFIPHCSALGGRERCCFGRNRHQPTSGGNDKGSSNHPG